MSSAKLASQDPTGAAVVPVAPPPPRALPVAPAPRFLPTPAPRRPTRAQRAIVTETIKRGSAQDAHRLLGEQAVAHITELHDEAHAAFVQTAHTIRARQSRYEHSPAKADIDAYTDETMAMAKRHTLATVETTAYQIARLAEQPIYRERDPGLVQRIKAYVGVGDGE